MIYLDNAATSPLCKAALDAMCENLEHNYGNPSSIHAAGRKAKAILVKSRRGIAKYLKAKPAEIFFTSCGTESNNTAIKNSVRDLRVNLIISTRIEHHSVTHTLDALEESGKVNVHYLPIDGYGRASLEELKVTLEANTDKTILVSLMHANNEIGTVNDIHAIGELCREHNAYFHSDTVQSMAHLPIDLSETHIHFLSGSAHKFHGPKGVGFLYINEDLGIRPFLHGGGQEREMRAGTENVAGIASMYAAFEDIYKQFDEFRTQVDNLRKHMKNRLLSEFTDIQFTGCQENYLQTVLNVSFPPHPKNKMLLQNLDLKGICVSGGSACNSGAQKASHVLNAIYGDDYERSNVRFSFSHFNTVEEIDMAIQALKEIFA